MKTLLLPLLLCAAPALSADAIDDLIENGREKLATGDVDAALEFFNQADGLEKGALRSRMWVLRAHFEKGEQIFDAFDEVDKLASNGKGADIDYLYGMGSYFKAKLFVSQGVTDSSVTFAFADAQSYLSKATDANGEKFYDAWFPLAESCWLNSDLDSAAAAAAQAIQVRPKDPAMEFLAGEIALSQGTALNASDAKAAKGKFESAASYFETALGKIKDKKKLNVMAARTLSKLGDCHAWLGDTEAASESYSSSMGLDPGPFNYSASWNTLGLEGFIAMCEAGAKSYESHYGANNSGDATLLWWLGSAYFSAAEHEKCEATYERVVQKWPAFTNSWFYIGMSRYFQEDYDGTVDAWHENWKADATDLVRSFQGNYELNLQILSFVLAKCAEKGQPPGREPAYNVKAAFLAEVRCAIDAENWVHWNDWGLFGRDGGQFLFNRNEKPEDRRVAMKLFEDSWAAYQRAMEMAPDKPHLKNDGAVLLHYYLEREYDKAIELYDAAFAQASELLESGQEWSEEDRNLLETAKRDARNNKALLLKKMEK